MGRSSCIFRIPTVLLALSLSVSAAMTRVPAAQAQVVINEILPNPVGTDTGTERVEIYNAGAASVNLTGWGIDDAVTITQTAVRARIPEDLDPTCSTNAIIGPGEFRTVMMQGGAAVLNNTGDDVYLVSDRLLNATVVQKVTYPNVPAEGQTWACVPNGTLSFAWRTTATLCATNGGGGDAIAPGTVTNLQAVPGDYPGEIRLTWTAPGDDGAAGTASDYIIKVAHAPITSGTFDAATDLDRWLQEPLPQAGGSAETLVLFGLDPAQTWYFALKAQDEVPNTSAVSNSPGAAPLSGAMLNPDLGYTAYFGNLHSHTSYSDGVQTPPDAFAFARLSAPTPLDFLAVTDHNHLSAGMHLPSYALGLAQAASANDDGHFVAIWGQEWGIIASGGHANVFEAPVLFGWDAGNYDVFVAEGDYTGLYTAYLAHPPAGYPPVVEWCHPSSGDFNSYAVTADGKSVVHDMAMISGPAFSTAVDESDAGSTTGNEALFQDALRKGYRVSPTGDQDNHNATWGASTQARTAVLTSGLTKGQVLGALAARRNYATMDHNTVVQFSADGHPMGAAWASVLGVRIVAHVNDPDPLASVKQIDLLRGVTGASNAVVVATTVANPDFAWREQASVAPGTEIHYYLRITMNDNKQIWTGPVYVTYDPATTVAVPDGRGKAFLSLRSSPNPAHGDVNVDFSLPQAAGRARLAVHDISGRLVRTLLDGPLEAGPQRVTWDGRGDDGLPAAAGIFFVRLESPAGAATGRILLLR